MLIRQLFSQLVILSAVCLSIKWSTGDSVFSPVNGNQKRSTNIQIATCLANLLIFEKLIHGSIIRFLSLSFRQQMREVEKSIGP